MTGMDEGSQGSVMPKKVSTLIKTLRRNWTTNLILLLIIGLVAWVAIGELWGSEGKEREKEEAGATSRVSITASELGQQEWQVGSVRAGENAQVYEVTVVGANEEPLFKFKVDAFSAQPLAKGPAKEEGDARATPIATTPLPPEAVVQSANALLPQLETGVASQRGREPFLKVPIMYGELKIGEARVDAATKQVIPLGKKPPQTEEKEGGREEKEAKEKGKEKEKGKIVPKNLALPLGYLSALIAIVSALYYSWKRSLYAPIRVVGGEAKARAAAGLRQTLTVHMAAGAAALALAVLHVLNFTQKLRLKRCIRQVFCQRRINSLSLAAFSCPLYGLVLPRPVAPCSNEDPRARGLRSS
jgi:hypothetical protein